VLGWTSTAVGTAGLVGVAATADHAFIAVLATLAVAVLFGGYMWFSFGRKELRRALDEPLDLVQPATIETSAVPLVTSHAPLVLLIAACIFFGLALGPVGIALGAGFWRLGVAHQLRLWERERGRTLFATRRRIGVRIQRGQLYAQ
jgi:formate hydrogenlyase subunit 3/multisubunit Na+/H+ antiporter MnhD subunit